MGELRGLKSHLDSDKGCDFAKVACTNAGCRERVTSKPTRKRNATIDLMSVSTVAARIRSLLLLEK